MTATLTTGARQLGLILVSHGSPAPDWNRKMEEIAGLVRTALAARKEESPYVQVKLAHLEFAQPSIADVCDEFELLGCERIIALPIFISVSSHTIVDIPNALNLAFHPDHESDIRRYLGRIPVTLLPTLDHGPVLPTVVAFAATEVVGRAESPRTEMGALILSHGDGCEHFWNHMHRKIAAAVTAATQIETVDWVVVQTGRSEASKLRFSDKVKTIFEENPHLKKLVVLSCFTGVSGEGFLDRLLKGQKDDRLVGCKGWNAHPQLVDHFVQLAIEGGCVAAGIKIAVELEDHQKIHQPPYNPPFYLTRDRHLSKH